MTDSQTDFDQTQQAQKLKAMLISLSVLFMCFVIMFTVSATLFVFVKVSNSSARGWNFQKNV